MAEPLERRRTKLRDQHRHAKRWQQLKVRSVEQLDGQFVRISFDTGETLFETHGYDDVVVLYFPVGATDEQRFPAEYNPENYAAREYTVRCVDQAKRNIVVDFLLHEAGIATQWARTARTGETLWAIPTRMCKTLAEATYTYLFADPSATPAAQRFHDEAADTPGQTVLLGVSAATRDAFARSPRQIFSFADSTSVDELIAATELTQICNPEQSFIWIAGEAVWVGCLRRKLINEYRIPKENIQFTGYWRAG